MKPNGLCKTLLFIIFAIFFIQATGLATTSTTGNLIGFIYEQDGTTPVQDAMLIAKNLDSGMIFTSSGTDEFGAFRIKNLDVGLYAFGISTPKGDFNAEGVLGVASGETAKIVLAVRPYETLDEMNASDEAPKLAGEKLLGRIIVYFASTHEASIYILKGELNKNEAIHVYGKKKTSTDFWQKATAMVNILNHIQVDRALANQEYMISLEKPALPGDWIYKKEQRLLAFFTTPIGIITILAATSTVTYIIVKEPECASQYRK